MLCGQWCRRLYPPALLLDEPNSGADEAEHCKTSKCYNGCGRLPRYLYVLAAATSCVGGVGMRLPRRARQCIMRLAVIARGRWGGNSWRGRRVGSMPRRSRSSCGWSRGRRRWERWSRRWRRDGRRRRRGKRRWRWRRVHSGLNARLVRRHRRRRCAHLDRRRRWWRGRRQRRRKRRRGRVGRGRRQCWRRRRRRQWRWRQWLGRRRRWRRATHRRSRRRRRQGMVGHGRGRGGGAERAARRPRRRLRLRLAVLPLRRDEHRH